MEALSPQQLANEGQAEYQLGNHLSAASLFKAAADSFYALGDELQAAEMANNCSVAYLKAGEAQVALDAALGTDKIFASMNDQKRQAMALGNQAAALEQLHRLDEAMEIYRRSAELFNRFGEYELRAYVLQSLSALLFRKGRYLEAYATMRAGVMAVNKPTLQQKLLKVLIDMPYKFLK